MSLSRNTWVALLRGINLGRHKRVPMAELRSLLASLGYDAVRTHLNSGNALFATPASDRAEATQLEGDIAAALQQKFGFEVAVLVRSADELTAVVDANPFAASGVEPKELHAVFLTGPAPTEAIASLDRESFLPDELHVGDRVIYVRLANRVMGSRLPDWERLLGLGATMRTWNVVTRLRDLASNLRN